MPEPVTSARARLSPLRWGPPGVLVLGALVLCAYSVASHGATDGDSEALFVVGSAALALLAAVWVTGGRIDRPRADRPGWIGLALLGALVAWSALSLAWSVHPERTWHYVNREAAYALLVCVGIVAGCSRRSVERLAYGWLAIASVTALYALGGKVAPGVNVPGLFDLNHTAEVSRLRAPLEYWNALALVCVLAVPIALRLCVDELRSRWTRLGAMCLVHLFAITIALTLSRGAMLGSLAAVGVLLAFGGARLRTLLVLLICVGAAAIPIAVAFTNDALTGNALPLEVRINAGRTLSVAVVTSFGLVLFAGWWFLRGERELPWQERWTALVWRGIAAVLACAALGVVGWATFSDDGLFGQIDNAWDSFTETKADKQFDPTRLISSNSGNRWVWWKEAAGAWSDAPVGGHGAGSFPIVHRQYRVDQLPVAQPHNVPLQFLAETGLVGFLLGCGGLALLLAAGARRAWRTLPAGERAMGSALVAAMVAWMVHGFFDWDWDIPGVTAPVLLFMGVMAARPGRAAAQTVFMRSIAAGDDRSAAGGRMTLLSALSLALIALVVSAGVPAVAQRVSESASSIAGDAEGRPAQLERAAARADLAARLDPLATQPLVLGASIAEGRGRLVEARELLLRAIDRRPEDPDLWFKLALLALRLVDRPGFERATQRLLELDPASGAAKALALRAVAFRAPPSASATATGTPLP